MESKIKLNIRGQKRGLKKKLMTIVVVIIFIAIGAAVFYIVKSRNDSMRQNALRTVYSEKEIAENITQVNLDAMKLNKNGDSNAADKAYDDAVASTQDEYQKCMYLMGKATLYFNKADYDTALKISKQAESYDKNDTIYDFIAQIYEKKGDEESALEYYKKALSVIDSSEPLAAQDMEYYQNNIKRLSND